ncbi:MAG: hypothetical protein ABWX74_19045 [Aeromicrobium sp.]
MDIDEPGWPLIDDFFQAEAEGKSAATVRRYARVRERLTAFLDTGDMSLGLGTHMAALLESERQFHDSGAFWTLFGPAELVGCLPSFLHETWLPGQVAEARTQISLVGRLLTVLRQGHIDRRLTQCAVYDAEAAVARARRDLARRSHPSARGDHMPDRFLQQPGPEW